MNELPRVHQKQKKPIIGLAGGIGAGKSTAARILESLGAAVIDSDRLSHEQFRDPEVIAACRNWWGATLFPPSGGFDRKALASLVFSDPRELARLEGLLYPRLARRRKELVTAYEKNPAISAIVLDAPKLIEVGLHAQCDCVLFVDADFQIRAERVAAARGWSEDELRKRENLLKPLDMKRTIADHVVVNHSGVASLRNEIERIFRSIMATFSS